LRPFVWLWTGLRILLQSLLLAWTTLAVYWSRLPWPWLRLGLAVAVAAYGIYALWWKRSLRSRIVFFGLVVVVIACFMSIQPTHDGPWRTDVAVMPRAVMDGDRVVLKDVRNFDYRTATDFTVRYEERQVQLSHLTSLDFYVSYWMPGPVAHTFVSFNFDNAPPVSISIEARPEPGGGFEPISSMFKQFGLIYVVADERDVVRIRTNIRHEDVYLYRIVTSSENARQLFLIYLERINQLADRAEFYHLLSNNCTLNIVRYARMVGKPANFDIRFLLNGYSDRALYRAGFLDPTLPLQELRRRSHINAAAQAADDAADFSQRIRAGLPLMQP